MDVGVFISNGSCFFAPNSHVSEKAASKNNDVVKKNQGRGFTSFAVFPLCPLLACDGNE